ncbi:PD40 domain-containing protein [Flagellimonas flava]|uniref:WD40-like Beta Propeller Repeat n=1 Tax=Flagellimonas flava TaxID=570519 RepID=A0A1M5JY47_9FLAO|nr:PD40 domain-containing protein [Allomuricauda flava]SHG45502.1 WD40-like Beta Propeller Repeat [Allomuricauda flava]
MIAAFKYGPVLFLLCQLQVLSQEFKPYGQHHQRLVQGIGFSPNSKILYFTLPHKEYLLKSKDSTLADEAPRLALYKAKKNGSIWGKPNLLPFSGLYKDYEPSISPNGLLLLFNSNRPSKGDKPLPRNGIWFSRFKRGKWKSPKPLSKLNTIKLEQSYATVSQNRIMVYVAEKVVAGKSKYTLYQTKFKGVRTKKGKPITILGGTAEMGDPWISPNGDYLIFTKYLPTDWQGSCDLNISFREKDTWSSPIPLQELNGDGPDFSPCVSPDGEWIYYRKNYRFVRVRFKTILTNYFDAYNSTRLKSKGVKKGNQ